MLSLQGICNGLPAGRCPHNQRGESVTLQQGDLMLCEDCTRSRFPTEAANSSENNSHNNENEDASIFNRLSLIVDDDAFTAGYCNNLSHIYQYDKK